ncbi:MAG: lipocalin-like domain-containing protein [Chloroflexota bacterium]
MQGCKMAKLQEHQHTLQSHPPSPHLPISPSPHLLVLLLLTILLTACSGNRSSQLATANVVEALSGPSDDVFERAYEPIAFEFPLDHGAHPEYKTEWWYYTGNLEAEDGAQYGYQFTIFRSALTGEITERSSDWATNQIYMAHFAVTDVENQEHYSFERYSRGAGGLAGASGDPAYEVWLEDWRVEETEPGVTQMVASTILDDESEESVSLALELRETRPAVLHGDAGLSQKGPEAGNASYYYSLVGLDSTGTVTIGDSTAEVTGVSWMDHEFGTSALSEDALGWDWFSVQLDNGMVFMFAQIRKASGGAVGDFEGTLVYPDGSQITIHAEDFTLTVNDEWTSPRTDITYPASWSIVFAEFDIDLEVKTMIPDQEMKVSFVYYEGAIDINGTVAGEAVEGRGYVELTGYGQGEGGR